MCAIARNEVASFCASSSDSGRARVLRQRLDQRAHEPDVAELDAKLARARRPRTRAIASDEHLGVAVDAGQADALDAGLRDLAVAARAPALAAKHAALVAEPKRRRLIGQPRRDDARDLRRDVGPQHRDLTALRLDEAQQVAALERVVAALHDLGVLEHRRQTSS